MNGPNMWMPEDATYRVQYPLLFPSNSRKKQLSLTTQGLRAEYVLLDCCKERVCRQETQIEKQEQGCEVQGQLLVNDDDQ